MKQHGKDGSVTLNGNSYCVTKWEAELKYDTHGTDSTCDGDFKTSQKGKKEVTFTLEADLDESPSSEESSDFQVDDETVAVVLSDANGAVFTIPTAIADSIKYSNPATDLIKVTISGKSTGSFTTTI